MDSEYSVKWERYALRQLGQCYNKDYEGVYNTSKLVLSRTPLGQSYGSVDYPNFEYNELTNLVHFPQVSLSIKRLIKKATTLDN